MNLANRMASTQPEVDELALFCLGQSGFGLKNAEGVVVMIDPYLSDYCLRAFGFKRMTPSVMRPGQVAPDLLLITHRHGDHLDPDALPAFARNGKTFCVAAPDCIEGLDQGGFPANRRAIATEGMEIERHGVKIRAVFADHGELAPHAVGYEVDVGGLRVYFTGDTAYRPDAISASVRGRPDIMVAPINGAYNNMNSWEACALAARIGPRVLIPCHFGMFIEHGGDPAAFLRHAEEQLKDSLALVMAPGEELLYRRSSGVVKRSVLDPIGGDYQTLKATQ